MNARESERVKDGGGGQHAQASSRDPRGLWRVRPDTSRVTGHVMAQVVHSLHGRSNGPFEVKWTLASLPTNYNLLLATYCFLQQLPLTAYYILQ